VCGDEAAALVARVYDVRPEGNWHDPHGHGPQQASILHLTGELIDDREAALLEKAKAQLLLARRKRIAPLLDDKILSSTNGLALAGLADAARVLDDEALRRAARTTARFLLDHMRDGSGRLYRTKTTGQPARLPGTLDDHAFVADGLIALYEATGEGEWFDAALALTRLSLQLFYDERRAAMFLIAATDEPLVVRPSSFHDLAIPSGLAVAVQCMLRLGAATGDRALLDAADRLVKSHATRALTQPFGLSHFVSALDLFQRGTTELVLAGAQSEAFARAIAGLYLPNRILVRAAGAPATLATLIEGKTAGAYVCRNFACERPETAASALAARLRT